MHPQAAWRKREATLLAGAVAVVASGAVAPAWGQTPPAAGYSITEVSLTGSGYEYAYRGGTSRYSDAYGLNAAGQVTGYTRRYNALGDALGQDGWLWTGSTTQVVGLTGSGYEGPSTGPGGGAVRHTWSVQLNAAGQASGYTLRCNALGKDLGYDAWLATGSATQLIGLTGAGYEYAYTGPGGGTYRRNIGGQINAAGQVIGTTERYNASGTRLGGDAWLWTGSTAQVVGLTGSGYEYASTGPGGGTYRSSARDQLNAAGQVAGHTRRFNASGTSLGYDAWL